MLTKRLSLMKIAQVAPLYESVPPQLYGGTERIVAYLTDALVELGHDVTLFASGDSHTRARLVPVCRSALRLDSTAVDPFAHHIIELQKVQEQLMNFDAIHYHIDYVHFPLSRINRKPQLTTLHGRLDLPDLPELYHHFTDMPVVSISDAQRQPLPQAHWVSTVYHGLPEDLYRYAPGDGDYLAFIGRVSPEKRVDRAIEIAQRVGMKLKIAAKVDPVDEHYYEQEIKPLFDHPLVEFIGEIGEAEKGAFLGRARALLFPIDWPEPFGMVMIEAMACGTPVVAFRRGSVPEVIDVGESGFVVDSVAEAVEAVRNIDLIDRTDCRRAFERRFLSTRMAQQYVELYEHVIRRANRPAIPPLVASVSSPVARQSPSTSPLSNN